MGPDDDDAFPADRWKRPADGLALGRLHPRHRYADRSRSIIFMFFNYVYSEIYKKKEKNHLFHIGGHNIFFLRTLDRPNFIVRLLYTADPAIPNRFAIVFADLVFDFIYFWFPTDERWTRPDPLNNEMRVSDSARWIWVNVERFAYWYVYEMEFLSKSLIKKKL